MTAEDLVQSLQQHFKWLFGNGKMFKSMLGRYFMK